MGTHHSAGRVAEVALAPVVALVFALASLLGVNPYQYGVGDNSITIPFVKAFVTETKGRSLEEIEADLQRSAGRRRRQEVEPQQAAMSR